MNVVAYAVMFGWIPLVAILFMVLPPRRAMVVGLIAGWLFLPHLMIWIPGIPNITRASMTSLALLIAGVAFDSKRLAALRPTIADIPAAAWVFCPLLSSTANGLGLYDGLAVSLNYVFMWGIPYVLGRAYFTDWESVRELAIGIFIGGLVYAPLCLVEMVKSPMSHLLLYGEHPFQGAMDAWRFGAWRPIVFMSNGLELGMWMTCASLCGVWLWQCGTLTRLMTIPMSVAASGLVVVTVLCRSMGALTLLVCGLGVLWAVKMTRLSSLALVLAVIPVVYVASRSLDPKAAYELVDAAAAVSDDRAGSLRFRMQNEDILVSKAMEQPIYGWGGWGRNRVRNENGDDVSVTDGQWILALGLHGFVGLTAMYAMLGMPVVAVWRRIPAGYWTHAACGPVVAMAVMAGLFGIDCLFNAMINPIYMVGIGAVISVTSSLARSRSQPLR